MAVVAQVYNGFIEHKAFIFFNTIIHVFAGIMFATALYPLLNEELRKRYNYVMVVLFPAAFGSLFPDLIFILSVIFKHRAINGLFNALSNAGDVYTTFQYGLPIILAVPTTVFLVLVINKLFKKKFDALPKWSFTLICIISLVGALFHLFLDSIGF